MINLIYLFLFLFSLKINCKDFEGYKVIKAIPKTEAQLSILKDILTKSNYDVWSHSRVLGSPWVFMTDPTEGIKMKKILAVHDIFYREMDSNVGSTLQIFKSDINNETFFFSKETRKRRSIATKIRKFSFQKYIHYNSMMQYMEFISQKYPSKVKLYTIGKTTENRLIQGVKIFSPGENKSGILIDAGIHAREWLAPATALYLISQLAENLENVHMLENVDWYIFPSINPDGYEFSLNEQPLWRKTRSRGKYCNGVDANRNFNFHWNETGTVSSNECSEIYVGRQPFSEAESFSIAKFAYERKDQLKLYISLHSYGTKILYPWSWATKKIRNHMLLKQIGEEVAKAIRNIRGTYYQVGSGAEVLYRAPGNSMDWMYSIGIPLSYCIELPSFGIGFNAPPIHVLKAAKEIFKALEVFHYYVEKLWINLF